MMNLLFKKMFRVISFRETSECALRLVAVSSFIVVLWSGVAFAQTPPPARTGLTASAGTRAAAVLETVGYRAQQMVLQDLADLFTSASFFLYVIAAICVIWVIVVDEKYEGLLWFLIGPAMFFFLTRATIDAQGVEWRVGNTVQPGVVYVLPNGTGAVGPSKVSWFFHSYNVFVSNIIQELTRIITDSDAQDRILKATSRGKILQDLLGTVVTDGGLKSFLVESLTACDRELDAARVLAVGKRDPFLQAGIEYKAADATFQNGFTVQDKQLYQATSKNYLRELFDSVKVTGFILPDGTNQKVAQCATDTRTRILAQGADAIVSAPVSCEQLWCWMGLGIQQEVIKNEEAVQSRYGIDDTNYKEILEDISIKLTSPNVIIGANGLPLGGTAPVAPDLSMIPVVIGGYILRDLQRKDFHSGFVGQLAEHAKVERERYNFNEKLTEARRENETLKSANETLANTKRYELVTFALNLPYMQGVLLYGLGLLFPFFALIALVPGRGSAVIMWMLLWAWVKSWDFGLALVSVVEEFLWDMMPHSAYYNPLVDPNHGPISIFEAAFSGDPAYSLSNYYVILCALTTAVPVLSAQLFLGAKAGVVMPMVNGIASHAQSMTQGVAHFDSLRHARAANLLKDDFYRRYVSSHMGQMPNNPVYRRAIGRMQQASAQLRSAATRIRENRPDEGLAIQNLAGQFNIRESGQDLAMAFDREANRIEAQTYVVMAQAHFHEASLQPEALGLESMRAGFTTRQEQWAQPTGALGVPMFGQQVRVGTDANQAFNNARFEAKKRNAPIQTK